MLALDDFANYTISLFLSILLAVMTAYLTLQKVTVQDSKLTIIYFRKTELQNWRRG